MKLVKIFSILECIHVGSLILEAVKTSMNKGSDEWESLILCARSIHALIDEIQMKSADLNSTKQLETKSKTENLDNEITKVHLSHLCCFYYLISIDKIIRQFIRKRYMHSRSFLKEYR